MAPKSVANRFTRYKKGCFYLRAQRDGHKKINIRLMETMAKLGLSTQPKKKKKVPPLRILLRSNVANTSEVGGQNGKKPAKKGRNPRNNKSYNRSPLENAKNLAVAFERFDQAVEKSSKFRKEEPDSVRSNSKQGRNRQGRVQRLMDIDSVVAGVVGESKKQYYSQIINRQKKAGVTVPCVRALCPVQMRQCKMGDSQTNKEQKKAPVRKLCRPAQPASRRKKPMPAAGKSIKTIKGYNEERQKAGTHLSPNSQGDPNIEDELGDEESQVISPPIDATVPSGPFDSGFFDFSGLDQQELGIGEQEVLSGLGTEMLFDSNDEEIIMDLIDMSPSALIDGDFADFDADVDVVGGLDAVELEPLADVNPPLEVDAYSPFEASELDRMPHDLVDFLVENSNMSEFESYTGPPSFF